MRACLRWLGWPAAPLFLGVLLATPVARGYAGTIHQMLGERALVGDPRLPADLLLSLNPEDLKAFRTFLDLQFRQHPDPKLRAEYLRQFPNPGDLDSASLKTLLGFNPTHFIQGIDKADGVGGPALQAVVAGTAQPDQDGRNQDRVLMGHGGAPQTLPDGRPVPADPLSVNLGAVTGPSSQNYAHWALVDGILSTDLAVLKSEPRRFVVPRGWPDGPVKSLVRESTQAHYDLAVLAVLSNTPAGNALGHLLLGQAMHYLQDAGDQVQASQVGLDDFFFQARMATWGRSLKTLGGYSDELRRSVDVAMDIVANHRTLAEALLLRRMEEVLRGKTMPESLQAAVAGMAQDDKNFKPELDMAVAQAVTRAEKQARPPVATVIVNKLVDSSSREAADVFRHVAGAALPQLGAYGFRYDGETNPEKMLGDLNDPQVKAHLDSFYWLQAQGFSHIGTCMRLLLARFRADTTVADDTERAARVAQFSASLLKDRWAERAAERERMNAYLAHPPAVLPATVREPAWLVLELLTPVVLLGALVMALRRKPKKAGAPAAT